ncbi:hypothetical protein HRbin12_00855 [bacterium HR12]|nr:hypothetical protein HRbin12_00855 [bacterium HR12]
MRRGSPDTVLKPHVVVLALADLGGAERWVDTEDIAVRARDLAPEAFSWRKYPEQIDLDGVRIALHDAAKERCGHLVEGSVRSGWSLTPAGVQWVKRKGASMRRRLAGTGGPGRRDHWRAETRKRALERGRIRRLAAWRLWEAGRPVEPRQAEAVFRVDSETPRRDVHLKVQRMVELLGEDPSVGGFIREMAVMVTGWAKARSPARRKKEDS